MESYNINSNAAEPEEKQTVYSIDTNESIEDLSNYLSIRYQDNIISTNAKVDAPVNTIVRKPVNEPAQKWHWGAFFFPYYWTFKHGLAALGQLFIVIFLIRLTITYFYTGTTASVLAHFCSLSLLAIAGYCGLKGYQHGWVNQAGSNGVESYKTAQAIWTKWGFIINIPLCLIFIGNAIISTISANQRAKMQPSAYAGRSAAVGSTASKNNSTPYYNYSAPVVYQRTGSSDSTSRPLN